MLLAAILWIRCSILPEPGRVLAQPPCSFTEANGLPSRSVLAMTESWDGILWVGTEQGLAHYFDREFIPSTDTSQSGMLANVNAGRIQAVLTDPDGSLWVGTSAGLFRRKLGGDWEENLEQQAGLGGPSITSLLLVQAGGSSHYEVWVGAYNGLSSWDGQAWRTITFGPGLPAIDALTQDSQGRVWAAVPEGLFILEDEKPIAELHTGKDLPEGISIQALARGPNRVVWAATTMGVVELRGLDVVRIYTSQVGLADDWVRTLLAEPGGALWVGTDSGLQRMDAGGEFVSIDELEGKHIQSLLRDGEGNLWVGMTDGLLCLPASHWQAEQNPLLAGRPVQTLLVNTSKGDFAGTPQGLVYRLPGQDWALAVGPTEGSSVLALARDEQGQVYVGTDSGLYRFEKGQLLKDMRLAGTDMVRALLVDKANGLWLGTDQGIAYLSAEGGAPERFTAANSPLGQDYIRALWQTDSGQIWAGTYNGGAAFYSQGEWTRVDLVSTQGGLSNDFVLAGLEDELGTLWLGTRLGISLLPSGASPMRLESWRGIKTMGGLAGDQVNALLMDSKRPELGLVWVATDGGLSLVSSDLARTRLLASQFAASDGLASQNVLSLAGGQDQRLWVGTDKGLDYHRDTRVAPQLILDTPLVGQEPCDRDCLGQGLPYTSQVITFSWRGSDLGDLSGVSYLYTLSSVGQGGQAEPIEENWGTDNSYSKRLRPGFRYTFSVVAVDRDFNVAVVKPISFSVKGPNLWEIYTSWKGSGYLTFVVLVSVAYLTNRWNAWRTRFRRPIRYDDVLVSVHVDETSGAASVRCEPHLAFSRWEKLGARLGLYSSATNPDPVNAVFRLDTQEEIRHGTRQLKGGDLDGQRMRLLGSLMHQALFAEKESGKLLNRLLDSRRTLRLPTAIDRLAEFLFGARRKLRLRLEFPGDARSLADLPWELLYDPQRDLFFGKSDSMAVVRFVGLEELPRREYPDKLRILVVMAQPDVEMDDSLKDLPALRNLPILNLQETKYQFDAIQAKYSKAEIGYVYGLHAASIVQQPGRAQDLLTQIDSKLREGIREGAPWDVLHFVGHAGPDPVDVGNPEIVLYGEGDSGNYLPILVDELQKVLAGLEPESAAGPDAPPTADNAPALVVLSACQSADFAARLVTTRDCGGVGATVGMHWPVMEADMQQFVDAFYDALFRQGQVDYAVNEARGVLARQPGPERRDWAAPVLVTQRDDGFVFEITKERKHGAERVKHP